MRWLVAAALVLATTAAHADDAVARAAFVRGVERAKRAEWADALASFEASLQERPHPVTRYNIALCQRALGHPVRAVHELERALEPSSDPLPEATRAEATKLLAELTPERAFVVVERGAEDDVRVDGLPLEPLGAAFTPGQAAGALPVGMVQVALDPGRHEIRVARDGFSSTPWIDTLRAGDRKVFQPAFTRRPGLLAVTSAPAGARARIDGAAPRSLPLVLTALPGEHRIEVELAGYHPFKTHVAVRPDVRSNVHATLTKQTTPLVKRWWFWTGIAAVVGGGVVLTYALTRPESAPSGGSLGWVVR